MAYQIIFTKRFSNKVVIVSKYLEKEWSFKVSTEFLAKVDEKIFSISLNPNIGSASKLAGIRKIGVTKHNRIYYRIKKEKVILLDFIETKMNPNRNRYE